MNNTTTPDNSRDDEQKSIVRGFKERGEDPFDRKNIEQIFIKKDDAKKYNEVVYENPLWYAIPNLWPLANANNPLVIITQRNGILDLKGLSEQEWDELLATIKSLSQNQSVTKGAFCMRFGDSKFSGTTVTHLHGHLISARKNTSVEFPVGAWKNPYNEFAWEKDLATKPVLQEDYWQVRISKGETLVFEIQLKHAPLCDLWNLTQKEWQRLMPLIGSIIETHDIQGGAWCVRFDPLQGVQIWLLAPKENEKFIFKIKN